MVAYSFKRRFVPAILSGRKTHTIRAERAGRSRHVRPGETIQHYVGMRTRQCQKVGTATCWRVIPIRIVATLAAPRVEVCRRRIDCVPGLDRFAQADGFVDWRDMLAFWRTEHPEVREFDGVMICWHFGTFVAAAGAHELAA